MTRNTLVVGNAWIPRHMIDSLAFDTVVIANPQPLSSWPRKIDLRSRSIHAETHVLLNIEEKKPLR